MLYYTGKKEEERKSGESGHVKTLASGFSLKTRGVTSPGSGVSLSHYERDVGDREDSVHLFH